MLTHPTLDKLLALRLTGMVKGFEEQLQRHAGRVIFDLAVAVTQENGTTPQDASVTRAELRAVAADLRYTGGYLRNVIAQSAMDCDLEPDDDELARFAGKLAGRVGALVEKIERRLS
ncbi:MAG TPA: hypothetical protein VKY89_19150 [Thermoanaerobaculia bacterium]|nr:hypothetical protein [Thermoanaerobaculia bacterium]